MIKKALIGLGAAGLLAGAIFGSDVFSYARTGANSVRHAVKAEVPLEFEIERARDLVANLVPDIKNCMHVIAEQEVDIEHLNREIARKEQNLLEQKGQILVLRQELEKGEKQYVFASRTYSADDVRRDLALRFEKYKGAEDSLQRDRQILAARNKALAANQQKLDDMLAAKQNLEVQLAQLDARLRSVRAAETVSTLHIDDSGLTQAKKLIGALNKQLDVREKLLDSEGKFTGLIPIEPIHDVPENIGDQIDQYFSGQSKSGESKPEASAEL